MAKMALFIGWGEAVRGREAKAAQVFGEALAYFRGLQEKGEIDSFEPVLIEPHGGDLNGFMLVRGDDEKLMRVWRTDEFAQLVIRTRLIVDRFGVAPCIVGEELARSMGQWAQESIQLS